MSLSSSSSSSSSSSATNESLSSPTRPPSLDGWISFGIPFRPSRGTYQFFDAKTLPPIETKEFDHLKTLADVKSAANSLDEQISSCTSSYVQVDEEDKSFYRDQQDCCVWHFDPLIGVYVHVPSASHQEDEDDDEVKDKDKGNDEHSSSSSLCIVAHSLAEFFARLKMENDIWHKTAKCPHPDAFASQSCLFDAEIKDPQGLWTTLCDTYLTASEQAYLDGYFKASTV